MFRELIESVRECLSENAVHAHAEKIRKYPDDLKKKLADHIHSAARDVGKEGRYGDRKVFLNHVHKHPSLKHLSRDELHGTLHALHHSGHIELHRKDLAHDDPDLNRNIEQSHSEYRINAKDKYPQATFHLISDPSKK